MYHESLTLVRMPHYWKIRKTPYFVLFVINNHEMYYAAGNLFKFGGILHDDKFSTFCLAAGPNHLSFFQPYTTFCLYKIPELKILTTFWECRTFKRYKRNWQHIMTLCQWEHFQFMTLFQWQQVITLSVTTCSDTMSVTACSDMVSVTADCDIVSDSSLWNCQIPQVMILSVTAQCGNVWQHIVTLCQWQHIVTLCQWQHYMTV